MNAYGDYGASCGDPCTHLHQFFSLMHWDCFQVRNADEGGGARGAERVCMAWLADHHDSEIAVQVR